MIPSIKPDGPRPRLAGSPRRDPVHVPSRHRRQAGDGERRGDGGRHEEAGGDEEEGAQAGEGLPASGGRSGEFFFIIYLYNYLNNIFVCNLDVFDYDGKGR